MSLRLAAALWVVLGVALWNGVFDLYVSRGAREYLQLRAEYELHRGSEPSMVAVMNHAKRDGLVAASIWAGVVVMAGVGTALIKRRR